jgi:hypothetical protein
MPYFQACSRRPRRRPWQTRLTPAQPCVVSHSLPAILGGDLDVFEGSLSEPLASAGVAFYEHLAPIANRWNETLDVAYRYPASLDDFLQRNRDAGFRKKDLSQGALWKWQLLYIMQIMRSYVDPQWGWHPPHQRRLTYLDRDGLA